MYFTHSLRMAAERSATQSATATMTSLRCHDFLPKHRTPTSATKIIRSHQLRVHQVVREMTETKSNLPTCLGSGSPGKVFLAKFVFRATDFL